MKTKMKFKNDLYESAHASASALYKVGAIDKATMRMFDEKCIAKTPVFKPVQIKKIRERVKVSQPIFAMYLNTSQSTVQKCRQVLRSQAAWRLSYWTLLTSTGFLCLLEIATPLENELPHMLEPE